MSSFVVYEALTIGCKEGLKVGILWLVFSAYLNNKGSLKLIRPYAAGLIVSLLTAGAFLFIALEPLQKEYVGNVSAMSFALFLIASGGALLDSSGIRIFSWIRRYIERDAVAYAVVFPATIFFFASDFTGTAVFLKGLSSLNERVAVTFTSMLGGFFLCLGLSAAVMRLLNRRLIGSFFDLPQVLIFFSLTKLIAGGTQGFAELSLIPSVQRGMMKFSHDLIHQTFVMLMVPDHPLLKTTTWNFVGFFFGPNIASWESLFVILFLPLMFIYYSLFLPLPEPSAATGAERRKLRHGLLSEKRRKALPVIVFVCIIIASWVSESGEKVSALYLPVPKPVVEDKGMVLIPVTDPTMNLHDGRLHKFSLSHRGKEIKLIVMQKPDGKLSVCLDACEICEPDGYGQRDEYVVCIYCNTPIPAASLGAPGGCNPIPLAFTLDDRFVRIEVNEILEKAEYVNSGRSKEGIP